MIRINEEEFQRLAAFVKVNFGINLFHKKSLLEGRLSLMLSAKGFTNFSEYIDYMLQDTTNLEITELVNRITTNFTYFMREPKHFEYLQTIVLPYFENKIKDKDLRVWSAGCSTGEEPYTLAMVFNEYFGIKKLQWNTKVLATDISEKALQAAKDGIYAENTLKELSPGWKKKYFVSEEDFYKVHPLLKDEVIFRKFNLMDDEYPFRRRFHIIFCRNVMIYFDRETRKKLIDRFYQALVPGGYLFVGHSETITRQETHFKYRIPSVFQKEE